MQAFPGDTIRDIKLRLRNRGWFTSRHCLIFGNKELLEHETVAEVMRQSAVGGDNSAGQYLHIFVRLADVEGVSLQTLGRQGGMAFSSTAGEAGGFEYAACNGTGFGSPGFGSRSTRSAGVSGLTRGLLEAPRSLSELEEGAKAQSPPDDARCAAPAAAVAAPAWLGRICDMSASARNHAMLLLRFWWQVETIEVHSTSYHIYTLIFVFDMGHGLMQSRLLSLCAAAATASWRCVPLAATRRAPSSTSWCASRPRSTGATRATTASSCPSAAATPWTS